MECGMQNNTQTDHCRVIQNPCWYGKKKAYVFLFIILLCSIICLGPLGLSKSPMYIPSTPTGTTFGFVGIDYEYTIVTMNPDSFWMFDWGDGTNTSWLQLEKNTNTIVQSHQWSNPGAYQLHVKFKSDAVPYGIWSEAMTIEIGVYDMDDYPQKPIIQTAKILGIVGQIYTYSAVTIDPSDYLVSYRFDYNNGTLSAWTPFVPSGSSSYLSFAWQEPGVYFLQAQAKNQFGLESEWSDPLQIIIKQISQDNESSVDHIMLNNLSYQILFTSQYNGTFYNPSTGASNDVHWNGGGVFLIDDDCDGRFEYLYMPWIGQIQPYSDQKPESSSFLSDLPWFLILIILSIVFGALGVIVVLIKTGYIYLYEEEVVVEK